MIADDDIQAQVRAVFFEEQVEHRQALAELLVAIEDGGGPSREQLDRLFRHAHSLKGGASAAALDEIEALAHSMEDLFGAVRSGLLTLSAEHFDMLYDTLAAIAALSSMAAAGKSVPPDLYAALCERLAVAARQAQPQQQAEAEAAPAPPVSQQQSRADEQPAPEAGDTVRLSVSLLDALLSDAGELSTCMLRSRVRAGESQSLLQHSARWSRVWRQVQPAFVSARSKGLALRPTIHYLEGRPELADPEHSTAHELAVLTSALEQANSLIGELQRSLADHARLAAEDSARLAAVSDRLQDRVHRTRMLPLAPLFAQLRPQLREMSRAAGKQVELLIADDEAEADRHVLERLREMLLHLLRNAVDHGIEAAEARAAAGKPSVGRITLGATVSSERLIITVTDDGAGLDLAAIRRRAAQSGLVDEAELGRMDAAAVGDLIFNAGFSTRGTVGALSGRGVGLDVVRSNAERMRGHAVVESTPGSDTRFIITLPVSLATSQGLLVRAGGATYALMIDAVQRVAAVGPQDVRIVEGRPALSIDGRPTPLVWLADLLPTSGARQQAGVQRALLLGSGERQVACVVDDVLGEQGLVMHRLPHPLRRVRFLSGATILADGAVVPILDTVDVLRAALGSRSMPAHLLDQREERRQHTIMIVDDSITTRTLEKNILSAAGYRVLLATDGLEALQQLRSLTSENPCDLLLSDIDMPRMDGFELTAQVRSDPQLRRLPVVLVTSLDSPADRERGIAAGADAYIVKQRFDQQLLLDAIERLIS